MREAIGGTWLFQIVIVFVLLFTGYMCMSINHSKAYNVKSDMLDIIERYGGLNVNSDIDSDDPALVAIVEGMQNNSYRTTGKCPSDIVDGNNHIIGHYVGYNRDGKLDSNNPAFCVAEVNVWDSETVAQQSCELPNMRYYRIVVFYQLDLPVFQNLFQFSLKGDTKVISTTKPECK